jgi:carbonic anhydrase
MIREGLECLPGPGRSRDSLCGVNATPDTAPFDAAPFDDLLGANRAYAQSHTLAGFDGVARAGVAMVTCMDSRIDPLGMIGLEPGDAKILRNPGGRVTEAAMIALVLGVNLLGVERILVVQHTRCAMASASEEELHSRLSEASGHDATWLQLDVITDQVRSVREDVAKVRAHPLVSPSVVVGGFLYDVDSGLLDQVG